MRLLFDLLQHFLPHLLHLLQTRNLISPAALHSAVRSSQPSAASSVVLCPSPARRSPLLAGCGLILVWLLPLIKPSKASCGSATVIILLVLSSVRAATSLLLFCQHSKSRVRPQTSANFSPLTAPHRVPWHVLAYLRMTVMPAHTSSRHFCKSLSHFCPPVPFVPGQDLRRAPFPKTIKDGCIHSPFVFLV